MKKICVTLFLGMVAFIFAHARNNEVAYTEGPKVTFTIEFGKKPNCNWAFAVCRFDASVEGLTGSAETLSGGGGGGISSWLLSIPRDQLVKYYPQLLSKFDGQSSIRFEDTYTVPADLQNSLGSYKELIIQSNTTYPMKYLNGSFVITIPL